MYQAGQVRDGGAGNLERKDAEILAPLLRSQRSEEL